VKVEFRDSFAKDLKGVKEKGLLQRVREIIEAIEKADSLANYQIRRSLKAAGIIFV